jgi:hypothetical protein
LSGEPPKLQSQAQIGDLRVFCFIESSNQKTDFLVKSQLKCMMICYVPRLDLTLESNLRSVVPGENIAADEAVMDCKTALVIRVNQPVTSESIMVFKVHR